MKTAILYYSTHHGNTKKLLDAIAAADADVTLIDVTSAGITDLGGYSRVGLASGVYAGKPAKQLLEFAREYLPVGVPVFCILTSSMCRDGFFKPLRELAQTRECKVLGTYQCQGYDTFGPFKLVGGVSKGHPDEADIRGAVDFYKGL